VKRLFLYVIFIVSVFSVLVFGDFLEKQTLNIVSSNSKLTVSSDGFTYTTPCSLFYVADSGYIVYSGVFNPGTQGYVHGRDLELAQLYAFIVIELGIDTTYESNRRGISNGTIRIWITGKDSASSSWKLLSDTSVNADPGSLYVADTLKGYIGIGDTLKYIPFDYRIYAKCDSDSVGFARIRSDSYFEAIWRNIQGR